MNRTKLSFSHCHKLNMTFEIVYDNHKQQRQLHEQTTNILCK